MYKPVILYAYVLTVIFQMKNIWKGFKYENDGICLQEEDEGD